jgi:Mn-dependent DtxR family transcriptional regulator
MTMPLEERQAHRLQYLRTVYDMSEGVAGRFLRFTDVGEELGFDEKHSEELADYLAEEGLIKYAAVRERVLRERAMPHAVRPWHLAISRAMSIPPRTFTFGMAQPVAR